MPTEYAFPYAFDLTEAQYDRLLGLARRARRAETDRVARMASRPSGSHAPESIAEAKFNVAALAELEAALLEGSSWPARRAACICADLGATGRGQRHTLCPAHNPAERG